MEQTQRQTNHRPNVLLVNANSSTAVTAHLTAIAETKAPHIAFTPITPAFGPPYVLTASDVVVAAHAVLQAVETYVGGAPDVPDACLVACFGEVALSALRHQFPFPILNMAESGILTALQLGTRYGILAIGEHWPAMLDETIRLYGLQARYAGAFRVEGKPLELLAGGEATVTAITERILAIPRASVDVIIFGGAALTGLARLIQPRVPFKLVDCLDASLAQIEAALRYRELAGVAAVEPGLANLRRSA